MAFRLPSRMIAYEYRGKNGGTSAKTGKAWQSLIFEQPDGTAYQLEVTVPTDKMEQVSSLPLKKGYLIDLDVLACGGSSNGRSYSYVQLVNVLQICDNDGETIWINQAYINEQTEPGY